MSILVNAIKQIITVSRTKNIGAKFPEELRICHMIPIEKAVAVNKRMDGAIAISIPAVWIARNRIMQAIRLFTARSYFAPKSCSRGFEK